MNWFILFSECHLVHLRLSTSVTDARAHALFPSLALTISLFVCFLQLSAKHNSAPSLCSPSPLLFCYFVISAISKAKQNERPATKREKQKKKRMHTLFRLTCLSLIFFFRLFYVLQLYFTCARFSKFPNRLSSQPQPPLSISIKYSFLCCESSLSKTH